MSKKLDKDMIENIKNYGDKIETIESFVEAVRKIPGMYIGAKGNAGFINMIREIFQNSIDQIERDDSPCDAISVIYDERDLSVIVEDNGSGIPFNNIVRIYTTDHTSSNYTKGKGQYSAGVHGVGSKVTNALSSVFIVDSYILGEARHVEFYDGKEWDKGELPIPNTDNLQGTRVSFKPCIEIMGEITISCQDVFNLVAKLYPLTKIGSAISFRGIDKNGNEVISENLINQDGIITDLIINTISPIIKPITVRADNGIMKADIAFTYDSENVQIPELLTSFSNFCPTIGGTHVDGFLDGLTTFLKGYMNKIYLNPKSKLVITNSDIRTGLRAIVAVSHIEPTFTGQAKQILDNRDMRYFVSKLVNQALTQWAKENSSDIQKMCKYFKEIAEIRSKSEENKIKLSNSYKTNALSGGMPSKYLAAKNNRGLSLFIVEGDSAASSAKNSRDCNTQSLYPIRGKLPNAFAKSKVEFLKNEEVAGIITIIGAGYGRDFDIDKAKHKWDKIIFCCDADADGAHIRTLLLRFIIMYMPDLITHGMVYASVPPLYGIKIGKNKFKYFTNTLEYTIYVQNSFIRNNLLTDINGNRLSNNTITDLFVKNEDYIDALEAAASTHSINPYLLEYILFKLKNFEYNNFKKDIESKYRFLTVKQENSITVVSGLMDRLTHTVALNPKLLASCKETMKLININDRYSYILNDNVVSLYDVMKAFDKSKPDTARYKGLGEQNPEQLAESVLLPDNRTLIRYNIEDLDKELSAMRFIESDKSKLLENITIKRKDIE